MWKEDVLAVSHGLVLRSVMVRMKAFWEPEKYLVGGMTKLSYQWPSGNQYTAWEEKSQTGDQYWTPFSTH